MDQHAIEPHAPRLVVAGSLPSDPVLRWMICSELGDDLAQGIDASRLVILTVDVRAWENVPHRRSKHTPKEVVEWLVGSMCLFHEGRDWLQRDEVQRSLAVPA